MIELIAHPSVTTSQDTNSPWGTSMHLRLTGTGNSSAIRSRTTYWLQVVCTGLWFSLPILQSEILPTLGDGTKPSMHPIMLPLISLLAVTTAVESNWTAPGLAMVMSWNEKGSHGGATSVGGLWVISVEQFTGELIIHVVVADIVLSWLQVSEISSPAQAMILPLTWDGWDVRKFEAQAPSLSGDQNYLLSQHAPLTYLI